MGMGQAIDIDQLFSEFILQSQKASPGGVATLDSNTKIPKAQINGVLSAVDVGAIASETDPTVASFTKGLTSNNSILTALNAASGTISANVLPSYVDDVLSFVNLAAFPVTGETGKIYVTENDNKTYRWTGSAYVEISSAGTATEALKLTTARTISTTGDATFSVSFDGTTNVSSAIALATVNGNVGAFGSASSIPAVTVNAKGQIIAVSTNNIGNELTALQALVDTVGFLRKTGDGAYSIDASTYLTGNQSISVTGDATGSGTTAISLTLANSGVAAGTYNALATQVRPFIVDSKGRITGVSAAVDITPPWSNVTGKPTTLAGYGITNALPLTGGALTGALTSNSPISTSNATPSTSPTTGANVVAGGQGIGGNQFVGGSVTATSFSGSGASLTALDASNISTGTLAAARLPAAYLPLTGGTLTGGVVITSNDYTPIGIVNSGKTEAGLSTMYAFYNMKATDVGGTLFNGLYLYSFNNGTFKSIPFSISDLDNVGIGTYNPSAKLHVAGDILAVSAYFSSTTQSTSPTTGASVIAGGQGIQGNQYVGGFSSLGGDANHPAIKIKVFTGTTAATEGGDVLVTHGVTASKIVSISVLVEYTTGSFVPNSHSIAPGYYFDFYSGYSAIIAIRNQTANSANILSKPFVITLIYRE